MQKMVRMLQYQLPPDPMHLRQHPRGLVKQAIPAPYPESSRSLPKVTEPDTGRIWDQSRHDAIIQKQEMIEEGPFPGYHI